MTSEPSEASFPVELDGLSVLVVEDSWQVGIALKDLLRSIGTEVFGPVASTADAERLLSEHRPDAAIVDINLRGGEQGFGLIDRLHDQGIHTIVVSGYENIPLAAGKVEAILQKPFREKELVDALCRGCRKNV
jgi:FixJ family two-component response regulator